MRYLKVTDTHPPPSRRTAIPPRRYGTLNIDLEGVHARRIYSAPSPSRARSLAARVRRVSSAVPASGVTRNTPPRPNPHLRAVLLSTRPRPPLPFRPSAPLINVTTPRTAPRPRRAITSEVYTARGSPLARVTSARFSPVRRAQVAHRAAISLGGLEIIAALPLRAGSLGEEVR